MAAHPSNIFPASPTKVLDTLKTHSSWYLIAKLNLRQIFRLSNLELCTVVKRYVFHFFCHYTRKIQLRAMKLGMLMQKYVLFHLVLLVLRFSVVIFRFASCLSLFWTAYV